MSAGVAAYATAAADCQLWSERDPQLGGGVALVSHLAGTIANCNWGYFGSATGAPIVVSNLLVTIDCGIAWGVYGFAGAPTAAPYEVAARVANTSFSMKVQVGDWCTYKFRLLEG
jgi:hypothetical protein